MLGPGLNAGVGQCLHVAARVSLQPRRCFGKQVEIRRDLDHAGAQQHQVVVVGRHAFVVPQVGGVGLARQVGFRQLLRSHALDVPQVKVLMAHQPQEAPVLAGHRGIGPWQVVTRAHQCAGAAVLKPAIAVAQHPRQEQVSVQCRFLAKQLPLRVADATGVRHQPGLVKIKAAGQRVGVRDAIDIKCQLLESAQFERMVDRFLVIVGAVLAEACTVDLHRGHCGGHPPLATVRTGRAHHHNLTRVGFLSSDGIKERAAIEESATRVEVGLAHGLVKGINAVLQHQRSRGRGAAQRALVDPANVDQTVRAARGDLHHVLGEVPHQVAAANPAWHGESLAGGIGLWHLAANLEQVGAGVEWRYRVSDHAKGLWKSGPEL